MRRRVGEMECIALRLPASQLHSEDGRGLAAWLGFAV